MQWVKYVPQNVVQNYVPHGPQIEVQFEVQIRVQREKSIQV